MVELPIGIRFHPKDKEMIHFLYLKNKGAAEENTEPLKDVKKSNGPGEAEAMGILPVVVKEEKSKNDKGKEKMVTEVLQASPMWLLQDKKVWLPTEADTMDVFLHEYDLFGKTEPWEIWDKFKGDELCEKCGHDLLFFTQLKRTKPNSVRVDRRVGFGGTWRVSGGSKEISDNVSENPIGRKRSMRYYNIDSPQHACWFLDEYSLIEADIGDYILCRLQKDQTKLQLPPKKHSNLSRPQKKQNNL